MTVEPPILNPPAVALSVPAAAKINRKLKVGLGEDTETAKKPGNDG